MTSTSDNQVDHRVRSYLARAGVHRNDIIWDEKRQNWDYPISTCLRTKSDVQEDFEYYIKSLPLFVPGLKIIESEMRSRWFGNPTGHILFTWSHQGMVARYQELYEEYGAADERLAFMVCSGKYHRKQLSLQIVHEMSQEQVISNFGFTSWTVHGIRQMEHSFMLRITDPNRGGLEANPHSSWKCEVGDDWWLVGSRGDSPEIVDLEIRGSCLEPRVKENLLYNLHNYNKSMAG